MILSRNQESGVIEEHRPLRETIHIEARAKTNPPLTVIPESPSGRVGNLSS